MSSMTLEHFIKEWPWGQRGRIRKAIGDVFGVKAGTVHFWATNRRNVPVKYVKVIEKLTDGKVTRYDLRPDVFNEKGSLENKNPPTGGF